MKLIISISLLALLLASGCGQPEEAQRKDQVFTLQAKQQSTASKPKGAVAKAAKNLTLEDKRKTEADLLAEADSLIESGQYVEAVAAYDKYLAVYPEGRARSKVSYQVGVISYDHLANAVVLERLHYAIATFPDSEKRDHALYLLCDIYNQQGEKLKVLQYGKQFIKEYPSSNWAKDVNLMLGQLYYRDGDYERAQKIFRLLVAQAQPGYADQALYGLGRYTEEVQLDHKGAAKYFKQLIDGYPKSELWKTASQKHQKIMGILADEQQVLADQQALVVAKQKAKAEKRRQEAELRQQAADDQERLGAETKRQEAELTARMEAASKEKAAELAAQKAIQEAEMQRQQAAEAARQVKLKQQRDAEVAKQQAAIAAQEAAAAKAEGLRKSELIKEQAQVAAAERKKERAANIAAVSALVGQHKAALEGKNLEGYVATLKTITDADYNQVRNLFQRYDWIVEFSEIQIELVDKTHAQVTLRQHMVLIPAARGKKVDTTGRFLWSVEKVSGQWKIAATSQQ